MPVRKERYQFPPISMVETSSQAPTAPRILRNTREEYMRVGLDSEEARILDMTEVNGWPTLAFFQEAREKFECLMAEKHARRRKVA